MYYPSTAGSMTTFVTPHYPVSRSYYPTAPMSAVMPGQHYYPAMHGGHMAYPASAAPVMVGQPAYGYNTMPSSMPYYGHAPTVVIGSAPSRSSRHRRSRSRGFLGYL